MTFGSEALSHKARSHGPRWRTAHASSVDEKYIYIYNPEATSAPPPAGTTVYRMSANYRASDWNCD